MIRLLCIGLGGMGHHDWNAAGEEPRIIEPEPPEIGTWQAFARAIESRQPTLTSSDDNLKSLEILFAAIQSAETGEIVEI